MTHTHPLSMRRFKRKPGTRGFTLLEIMVAIAAGLLIVLAISSLFASAGATIGAGRRISEFSRKGALIEQRIREDFRNLSRDGYMVIRHAVADDGPNPGGTFLPWRVPAFPDDPNPRLRRVDEIMFFPEGEFRTARAPLAPGFVAEGNVARVYYGHGAIADFAADEALFIPEYDMGLASGSADLQLDLGLLGQPGRPNEFAEDWILIRHQTVLVQPRSADQSLPTAFLDPYNDPQGSHALLMGDGDRQIAFQPALSSIFRHVNYPIGQGTDSTDMLREQNEYDRGRYLVPQSNLFDIATTDLREIRQRVMTMHDGQDFGPDYVPPADPRVDPLDGRRGIEIRPVPPFWLEDPEDLTAYPPKGYTPYLHAPRIISNPTGERANLLFNGIHAWMRNGMPTDGGTASLGQDRGDDIDELEQLYSIRMHVEPSPPELLTVLDPDEYDPETLEAADRLNEQLMLTASNLGVHVGDFMVEWTFGQTYFDSGNLADPRNGEIIWYGGHTLVDLIGNDELADNVVFSEYKSDDLFSPEQPVLAFDSLTGARIERATGGSNDHLVHDFLIHGPRDPGDNLRDNPLYSYFGWDDPTYRPLKDDDVASVPWAWPKMLRITISLIDSADPTIEQSFQFVIELDSEN